MSPGLSWHPHSYVCICLLESASVLTSAFAIVAFNHPLNVCPDLCICLCSLQSAFATIYLSLHSVIRSLHAHFSSPWSIQETHLVQGRLHSLYFCIHTLWVELVHTDILMTQINFLPIGHTHEDVDQMLNKDIQVEHEGTPPPPAHKYSWLSYYYCNLNHAHVLGTVFMQEMHIFHTRKANFIRSSI